MLVESGNPAHSLADSPRMREALPALDLLVVIDVSMTETARLAALRAAGVRRSTRSGRRRSSTSTSRRTSSTSAARSSSRCPGTLGEPEIHARLCEALGAVTEDDLAPLREAAAAEPGASSPRRSSPPSTAEPELGRLAPVRALPHARADAARRRRGRGRPVGGGAPLRPDLPGVGRAGRLRHRARKPARRCSTPSLVAVRARVHASTSRTSSWTRAAHRRRQGPPRHRRAARRAGRPVDRGAAAT